MLDAIGDELTDSKEAMKKQVTYPGHVCLMNSHLQENVKERFQDNFCINLQNLIEFI